jgi:predicted nucleic-acid-binding Zn-ribbon protein
MRTSETCPKCGSRKIYVVDDVHHAHPEHGYPMRFRVTSARLHPSGVPAPDDHPTWVSAGQWQIYVCARCGYTEWYAHALRELATLADTTGAVRVIDRSSEERGPYR